MYLNKDPWARATARKQLDNLFRRCSRCRKRRHEVAPKSSGDTNSFSAGALIYHPGQCLRGTRAPCGVTRPLESAPCHAACLVEIPVYLNKDPWARATARKQLDNLFRRCSRCRKRRHEVAPKSSGDTNSFSAGALIYHPGQCLRGTRAPCGVTRPLESAPCALDARDCEGCSFAREMCRGFLLMPENVLVERNAFELFTRFTLHGQVHSVRTRL